MTLETGLSDWEGGLYGLAAEFKDGDSVLAATRRAYDEGYRRMDAYAPFPVDGLAEALGFRKTHIPMVVLIGGIVGAAVGYGLQYWASAIAYPLNVGGRPLNSVPMFVPVTFELTILVAAMFAVFGMLALNGLPEPYHPLFNVQRFARASQDEFFLCIEARDPQFNAEKTRRFLQSLGAVAVHDVPP